MISEILLAAENTPTSMDGKSWGIIILIALLLLGGGSAGGRGGGKR